MKNIIKKLRKAFAIPRVSHSSIPKCECGGDCFIERPACLTFGKFGFEVRIMNFNKKIYSKYCIECFMDIEQEPVRQACAQAAQDGYNKCLDDHGF